MPSAPNLSLTMLAESSLGVRGRAATKDAGNSTEAEAEFQPEFVTGGELTVEASECSMQAAVCKAFSFTGLDTGGFTFAFTVGVIGSVAKSICCNDPGAMVNSRVSCWVELAGHTTGPQGAEADEGGTCAGNAAVSELLESGLEVFNTVSLAEECKASDAVVLVHLPRPKHAAFDEAGLRGVLKGTSGKVLAASDGLGAMLAPAIASEILDARERPPPSGRACTAGGNSVLFSILGTRHRRCRTLCVVGDEERGLTSCSSTGTAL
mmetsp:Transcript_111513/g.197481  ORF Transcript_111513/g.197481 Transcript_111513/m.197481 type:complete len:265 (-) Transcript_111513:1486-2280(-)